MVFPERFRLAALPTPLQRARRLERAIGRGPVWIKRDDLAGLATAGNKARPLEFLLGDAVAQRADVLVATGAPGSNFCAAAAIAAPLAGLGCDLLYAGTEPAPPPVNVQLARAAGASQSFDPALTRDQLDAAVYRRAASLRAEGRHPYPVPRGGATAVGALGFAFAVRELAGQCADEGLAPATVVLPTGSGATQAGMLAGLADPRGAATLRVVGACVSRPAHTARTIVLRLARECAGLLGTAGPDADDVDVRDVRGEGFGIASREDRHSAMLALHTEGLLLDDTYTAKAMTLLRTLAAAGRGPLVFWHTGGITGALAAAGRLIGERV